MEILIRIWNILGYVYIKSTLPSTNNLSKVGALVLHFKLFNVCVIKTDRGNKIMYRRIHRDVIVYIFAR